LSEKKISKIKKMSKKKIEKKISGKKKTSGKKSSGKKSGSSGKKSPAKKPRRKYGKVLTFKGKILTQSFSDKIRLLAKDLRLVGCFYTYNDVIVLLLKHIRWHMVYRKDPKEVYPCDKKFNTIAPRYFNVISDQYFHNRGLDIVEEQRIGGHCQIMYFRSIQGALKRYKFYPQYHERINSEYSIMWNSIWDWIAQSGEIDSPIPEIYVSFEEVTGSIFVDFHRDSVVSGYPLDPTLTRFAQVYYQESGEQ
jgi:hypothetical protein